jgi:tetratricopeptide (TPR) repeat protein
MTSDRTVSPTIPHNLGLYRLQGFSGRKAELRRLAEWMTGGDDPPAIAISGEQGNGKTTLATAIAWNLIHDFPDGIVRVGAAGVTRFRIYDVVRTLDSTFGSTMTRLSEERWGLSILEQLYRRRRLLILDELSGATPKELETVADIIAHLHEAGGNSRVMFIDRNFSRAIADLCPIQHIHLEGLTLAETPEFIRRRAPAAVQEAALAHLDELHHMTLGRPAPLRLVIGLLLDFAWDELAEWLRGALTPTGDVAVPELVAFAAEQFAARSPQAGPFLDRLVTAAGGASLASVRTLFWSDLGEPDELPPLLAALADRGLIELDPFQDRVVLHPLIRGIMDQGTAMLGEDWERRHAAHYRQVVSQYQVVPLERWPQIDADWGNVLTGADWCAARLERIWQRPMMELIADPAVDEDGIAIPPDARSALDDLRLARDYGVALSHYAFWRHPPGSLRWLAAGAVAALALADVRDYGWLVMNIGRQRFFTGQVEDAIAWFKRAEAIFDTRDLLAELAYALTDLGTSLRVLDRPRQALPYFRGAFECVAQMGDPLGLATAYMNLGSAHYGLNEYERALEQQSKALRIALRLHAHQQVASAFNSMGLALEGLERLDEAQQAYEQGLAIFRRINDVAGISACYNNLGSVAYARNDLGRALTWYELDLALSAERGAWTDMAATLHNLGHVALEQETWDKAQAYFEQSRDLYAAFALNDYVAEEEAMLAHLRTVAPRAQQPA